MAAAYFEEEIELNPTGVSVEIDEMAAAYFQEEIKLNPTGVSVTVPNHPRAKLMYYLSCMMNVIDLDTEGLELTDFQNYFRLTADQEQALAALCLLLNPLELLGKCLFAVPPGHPRLNGSSNEMYSIESTTTGFAATETVLIGGTARKVVKIMLFTDKWINDNYLIPIKSFAEQPPRRNVPALTYVSNQF